MAINRITTVIFDMYETLVENGPHLWQETFGQIIKEQELNVEAARLWQEWRAGELDFRANRIKPESAFQSYFQGWRDCFVRAYEVLGLKGDPSAAARKSILDMSLRDPYPETMEALRQVQQQGTTAILSNADDDYLLPNVELIGLDFKTVLSSEAARAYKPAPGLFQQMLQRLDVSSGETVYVGDRQFEDVLGASQAGMRSVWINRSGAALDPQLPAPDYQISSLLELPAVLAGQGNSRKSGDGG